MSNAKKIFVQPSLPDNLQKLLELSKNLWWTCDYEAVNFFSSIDPQLFREVEHNPIKLIYSLSREKLKELSEDKGFLFELEKIWNKFEDYKKMPRPFSKFSGFKPGPIAFFCMEFGIHQSFPIYAGGLGILAGDFLKGTSDLGLPVFGIGLLYKYGYFTQKLTPQGQEELLIEFENYFSPAREIKGEDGKAVVVQIKLLNRPLFAKLWEVNVGTAKIILLDTDIPQNPEDFRKITHELYVADRETRICQEILLGMGGIEALSTLNLHPTIYHLNEGHSAFLILARLLKLFKAGFSLNSATILIKNSTVFTTHTPLPEGNENFPVELVEKYLRDYVEEASIPFDEFLNWGKVDSSKVFWLPAFAIRFSDFVNAVSLQHRDVSRRMWKNLFPNRHLLEIPIDYVTNGVHFSWVSESFNEIFDRYLGRDWKTTDNIQMWERIRNIPDEEIWEAHLKNKRRLSAFLKRKILSQCLEGGVSPFIAEKIANSYNPEYLTVGFARRFAPYKRPNLLLSQKEKLLKILNDKKRPVFMIFAGKAHPADEKGNELIKEILSFIRENELEERVFFLENYDIEIARYLVWGVDVWLNTPAHELEASGTSGIKAGMNGVLNLSTLEGWWIEGFNGKNGWAVKEEKIYRSEETGMSVLASKIINILEEALELYYSRDEKGIPREWVKMMKESIITTCSRFNMNRVLNEYLEKFYIPSWKEYEKMSAENYRPLKEAEEEEKILKKYWDKIYLEKFEISERGEYVEGEKMRAEITLYLGNADPALLSVELFYLHSNEKDFSIIPAHLAGMNDGRANFTAEFNLKGYGNQSIEVRIRPSNSLIKKLHPEWLKCY